MDTGSVVAIVISAISATSALCAVLTFFINRGKDKHKDGIDSGNMRADIKYMRSGFDDLRLDVKEIARKQDAQSDRLARVEESVKSAHRRLDNIETQIQRGGTDNG